MFYKVLFVSFLFVTTVSSNVTAGENYLCISNVTAELPKNAQKLLILDQNTQQKLAYIDEITYTLSETNGVLAGQSDSSNSFFTMITTTYKNYNLELISGNNKWEGTCKPMPKSNCSDDVKVCTDAQVCKRGTRNHNGRKKWDTREGYYRFYTEARKRKLSCGIKTTTLNSLTQASKIIECKMVTAFNTNGTMREKEYFRIKNGNIEYNNWNFKKKRGEWLETNKKSDGKFKWSIKRPYNSNNLSVTFKVSFDLETDINMENILLRTLLIHNGDGSERYSSKGKCKIYKG